MDLALTVCVTATGAVADVHVVAPDLSPASRLLAELRRVVGADLAAALSVNGRPVVTDGTVADCGLVAGGIVTAGEPGAQLAATDPPPPCDLVVTSGPDAGRRCGLAAGSYVIGRDPQGEVRIADPAISRRHLLLTLASGTTTLTDLGSANGTVADDTALRPHVAVEVRQDVDIKIGDSVVVIKERPEQPPATAIHCSAAVINRAPRLAAAPEVVEVCFPAPQVAQPPVRIPALAAIAPLIAGVALSLLLRQWQFLAFTALSPIMILGQAGSDRWSSRRAARSAAREYDVATALAEQQLAEALGAERRRRHDAAPDLGQLIAAATRRGSILWQRAADDLDALTLRLGRGELPSEVSVRGGPGGGRVVGDVPICLPLGEVTVVGVCGPRDLTAGLLRSMVVQATTLLSPADLRLVVLAPGRRHEWAWVRWLPHLRPREGEAELVGFDDDQVASRLNELLNEGTPSSRTLVVVDGTAALRSSAAVAALLGRDSDAVSVIWLADTARELPGACRAVVELTGSPRPELGLVRNGHAETVRAVPDLLAADLAEATSRALAPLRASGGLAANRLPRRVRWSEVNDIDLATPDGVARSLARLWSLEPSTEIILGRGADGVVTIDLCRDGPHALVAGTTGAGKSELLVSLVASLVARNRPDQLSLLLIDHKGGAAFGRCARLPHTVGLVTDLDAASTQRALLSLSAEIRRRETLFAAVGATDLDGYTKVATGTDPLPRLVIVVDEFAALAEEQPEFVGGLVGIAQRGRSLGVHLILATQRPDGVVSADIRANTRLRICLSVARDNESRDVIDCPDAASISRTTPGRAYLRVGPGDLREFQAAQIGGGRATVDAARVTLSPAAALGDPLPAAADAGAGDASSDLDALTAAAVDVAAALRCGTPPPPWLPPLPELLATSTLPAGREPTVAVWGMVDLPAAGQQQPLGIDLATGATTLIAGTARSGRTSAVMTLATAAAAKRSPDQLQLWAIDTGVGLATLSDLPHCGAVISAHDHERIDRLLGHLTREVSHRRHHPDIDAPELMLVVDSWEGVIAAADDRDGSRLVDTVLRLAADGPSAGLHLAITADRSGLVGRLATAAASKIVLRLADAADFSLIGMPARDLPSQLPAGRGVRAADLALVQIGWLDDTTTATARSWPAATNPARRFDPLPQRIPLPDLIATVGRSADRIVIGCSAEDLSPVTIARHDIAPSFLIAGPPGSGRSTALLLMADQLSGRRVAISCSRRSPLAGHADAIQLPRDDQDHAVAVLDALCGGGDGAPDLLIDDIDLLPEGSLWARLEDLIRGGGDGGRVIAVAGGADAIAAAFRGPMVQARRAKSGLLLCPASPHDGEVFGIRLPRRVRGGDPPGRGWLAVAGKATPLQLADPGEPVGSESAGSGSRHRQLSGTRLLG